MGSLSIWHWIIVIGVVLLLFGRGKISELMGDYDWRLSGTNVWKVERVLLDHPPAPLRSSDARVKRLRTRYRAFRKAFPGRKPVYYRGRDRWSPLPKEFRYDG